ncbi:uncharacterized protein LOC143232197 [Tachypleus tridentatus]|uniref:uncharacterized protein LOC143232197 n=1 Tax=Tachypleus tridentatus TaxID=6853 RepID=UPI003FD3FCBF
MNTLLTLTFFALCSVAFGGLLGGAGFLGPFHGGYYGGGAVTGSSAVTHSFDNQRALTGYGYGGYGGYLGFGGHLGYGGYGGYRGYGGYPYGGYGYGGYGGYGGYPYGGYGYGLGYKFH